MSRGSHASAILAVAVLALVLVAAIPGSGAGGSAVAASAGQIDADTVLLDVSLQPDGDADWEIRYRVQLDDENATAAFESLERDIEANRSSYANQFETRIGSTIAAAENATGRDMAVRNVSVEASRQEIPQRSGVLVYSFEWTGFAPVEESRIAAGDAIGGLYLDGSTSLTIRWPEGYGVVSRDPAPDDSGDRSATWRGPMEFTTEQPRVVVSPAAAPGSGESGGGLGTTSLLAGAVVGLSVLVVGTWWWRRRNQDSPGTDAPAATTPPPAEPDEDLLSNEERVLRLLKAHGGRMKQQQVVEELGWTDAKTSQVVGDLRESGEVEGFRLGRENVLRLPEADERAEP